MNEALEGSDTARLRSALAVRFPTLHIVDGGCVIRGVLPIEHEGVELDRFMVEIELRPADPTSLPSVGRSAAVSHGSTTDT